MIRCFYYLLEVCMNKNELIASVSEASGLSKSDAGKAVDGVIGAITGA